MKQQLEKMESLHELEMKENEEETDALMGEVETLRIRLQKQKKTMLKQEETIETLKESREESELEWKKRCKIMANRANQDMEKLKSMMGSKLENERVTYRKDMKRLTQKFEEKQRKTVVAMKSSQDTKLEKLTKQRNRSWEKEKQKLVHTLNRVLNEKNRLEREQEERANVETKLHEILEGFRTLKLGSGDEDSENQQLQYLRKELKKLQKENGFLSGHHNMQQRIRHVQKLKLENAELSQTVDALNDKISTLERKLEVATEMMENSIVPSKDKKWDRLAASHNRENDGVSMKWKNKSLSRKTKKKRKSRGGDENGTQCAVCLDEMKYGQEMCELKRCGHVFHSECVDEWFKTKNSCPVCRDVLETSATTSPRVSPALAAGRSRSRGFRNADQQRRR